MGWAEATLEDEVYGATLRPRTFEEYVGQEQAVSSLRRILGSGCIETVPRRGYRFVSTVSRTACDWTAGAGFVVAFAGGFILVLVMARRRRLMWCENSLATEMGIHPRGSQKVIR